MHVHVHPLPVLFVCLFVCLFVLFVCLLFFFCLLTV